MLNVVVLMGRLVADPELRQTPSGLSVTTFRIAVDRNHAKTGQERQADFIDIVSWRQAAEFVCKYFRKGSMIAVQGSIQTRSYEDKNGNKRTAFEVVADNVSFTGSRSESAGAGYTGAGQNSYAVPSSAAPSTAPSFSQGSADDFAAVDENEDLPF